ncbi:hypothetical protein MSG28_001789 [Choristoneura fumiferana]|uniref:Uncharacterized protein n=1 Tax=Choristoneura fumiferana TaxID=7141 RepID=A0ACC0KW68_CHOFU|nr:hypothetical protein MSG28_001789 [Choristoneura fumiferana]
MALSYLSARGGLLTGQRVQLAQRPLRERGAVGPAAGSHSEPGGTAPTLDNMSSLLVQCLFLLVWFVHLDCEVYQDRPKIKTSNGDLILEPAFDKNIYLLPNGPKSSVYIGMLDLLAINRSSNSGGAPRPAPASNALDNYINGPNGILRRLDNLENRDNALPSSIQFNVSTIWRRINRINTKLSNLENQLMSMTRDACQSNPCQHGGTCLSLVSGYHCLCPSNWEGTSCDVDVNECRNFAGTDLGCQNGASCINKPGSYECQCKFGWFGLHCTRKLKDCSGGNYEMCGHGTCIPVPTAEGIMCICDQGWTNNGTGPVCLTDVNECDSSQGSHCSINPRVECINTPGSFRCGHCPPGYEGDGFICTDIDECLTIANGGCSPMVTCHNTIGSRICGSCPPGYVGDGVTCTWRGTCSINRGGCHPSARCIDSLGGQASQCVCPDSMAGDGVGLHGCYVATGGNATQRCENNPCIHGQCHALHMGYTCICFNGYSGAHCDTPADSCANNQCHNGGFCRQDSTLPKGFRCECSAQYTGEYCDTPVKNCGGILDSEEGSLYYPLHNSTYTHDSKCAWVIRTVPEKVINVTFSKFNLESSPECNYDFLQIHDGRGSANQLIGRFCGNVFPKGGNIISSHNYLYFWFRSDSTVAKDGFSLHWNSILPFCGGEIDATKHGRISSPGSPGTYPPNRDCYWHLQTTPGKRIQLHFFELDIEIHANCTYDYIAIYDGEHNSDPLISKYCNSTQPAPVHSAGSDILIHFHSDAYGSGHGFQISYAPIEGVPGCGGFFTSDKGEIVSPSYNGKYLHNLLCDYKIRTRPDTKIRITFVSFALERSLRCKYDYVKIYDGPSPDSRLYGKFCGNTYPKSSFVSSSNNLFIKFKSDYNQASDGFKITYETVCQHTIVGDSGVIKSPGYPFNYPENQVCEYIIRTVPGKAIQLSFQDFDVEDNRYYNCRYDNVEIRDGPDVNSTLLGRFCGGTEHTPPTQMSTHNYMYLRFNSDMSITGTGFYANYTTINSKCGGIYKESTGLINYPSSTGERYENDQSCTWILDAPAGFIIKLTWNRFDLEDMSSCNSDYLEISEIDDNNENNVLRHYCGSTSPPALTSSTNRLMLKFKSDSSIRSTGFSVLYSFLDARSHCGGTFIRTHGFIYSPGWPKTYDRNRDCTWTITVPAGQQIKLNISEFDLEQPLRGNCDRGDYLEIRNGGTSSSPKVGRYCGSFRSKFITSHSNTIYIHFHSDVYLTGRGFKIEWDGTITGCGGTLTSATGSISSPNYPQVYNDNAECFYKIVVSPGSRIQITFADLDLERSYPGNLNCLWTITAPKGHKINVTFTHFDIYKYVIRRYYPVSMGLIRFRSSVPPWRVLSTSSCDVDYLQTRQLPDVNFSEKLCGSTAPAPFSSKSNTLQIKFFGASSMANTGFRLEWVRYGCGGILRKRYGSLSVDKKDASDEEMECEWIIEAPLGRSISITFSDIYLTESTNCTSDAIEIYNGQTTNSPLISKICRRGPSSLQSNANIMLVRYVKKSNLRGAYFTAHFDSYRARCGGTFNLLSGVFNSKNYPQNYDSNTDCIWRIAVPKYNRIEINFIDIDLYSTYDDDCDDFIKIYETGEDLVAQNYSKLICPGAEVTQFISVNNTISVQFVSDSAGTAKGFKANFTVTCGAVIQVYSDGIISNEKFISHSNRSCTWTLVAPNPNQKITLTVTHISIPKNFDIVSNKTCPASYLRILEGNDENGPLIGEYCGNKVPKMIVSQGSALTIQLGTYTNNITGQFSAHYTALSNACGGTFTSEEGTIASPNFPLPYPVSSDCEWTLSTSPGNRVYVVFEKLDLEFSEGCNEDYLELRENDGAGPLIDVYCGNTIPTNITKASKIYLKFHSDNKNAGQGFLLHYGFVHGNEITGLQSGEISSPLYPSSYDGTGEFTWRIVAQGSEPLALKVDHLEIHTYGSECSNYLAFYDGYDDNAQLLQELCGVLYDSSKEFKTSNNIVFVKLKLDNSNTGSLFHVRWSKFYDVEDTVDEDGVVNCGANGTQLVLPGKTIYVQSPGYPDSYENDLNCEWIYKAAPGRHFSVEFLDVKLEERPNCFADHISVHSSETGIQWKTVKDHFCTTEGDHDSEVETEFMKISFISDYSITEKGFRAQIKSKCGGVLSDSSGEIETTWYDQEQYRYDPGSHVKCQWRVKVRPGHVIKFKFEHFNMTNQETDCSKYVTIRNGDARDSPLIGKYCGYSHEKRKEMESSSNRLYITYELTRYSEPFQNFRLHYEEKNVDCGVTSKLDADHSWEIMNTPNYPNIPMPYSECVWVFSAPVGEIIRVDFDRFDLKYDYGCKKEFLEIRDGQSSLSPLIKDPLCQNPGSVKSTGNGLYFKYVTQIDVPNVGFNANVSIDICGGTIIANSGELTSPGYPHLTALREGTLCEWHIKGFPGHVFQIQPQVIDLPDSESYCTTKVTIEDTSGVNKTIKIYCNEDVKDSYDPVETFTDEFLIKYYVGKHSSWEQVADNKGFRIKFNSSRPVCGGTITTPEGYLMTPGYPRTTTFHYCYWLITVPDKSRRIRLEIEDSDLNTDSHRIGIYNDNSFQTVIQNLPSEDYNSSNNVFESTGNKLGIYIWMSSSASQHRFKAKFSSNELALCGGALTGISGELTSPALERSYSCEWTYNGYNKNSDEEYDYDDDDGHNIEYKSIYINVKVNSSVKSTTRCRYNDPKLKIKAEWGDRMLIFQRDVCGNNEANFRIPSSGMNLKINAIKNKASSLYFHVEWKMQPCGGILQVGQGPVNILDIPHGYSNTIDCAWIIKVPVGNRVQIKLNGTFTFGCSDEFIKVSFGLGENYPVVGDYCKERMQVNALVLRAGEIYVQYHSNVKNDTSIKLTAETVNHQCGGYLTRYDRIFASPNYPKGYSENQECSWEIEADLGNSVSLQFIGRFVIEDTPNCIKDTVFVYDWVDDEYVQLARLCGRTPPQVINSTYNKMKVVLRTDSTINLDGFRAMWSPICGGNFTAKEKEQFLYSPGYPGDYMPSLDCKYKISAPGQKVLIKFLDFELEGTYPDCSYDNITITSAQYDYPDISSCGSEIPAQKRYSENVLINFKTDRYIQKKGFKLSYAIYSCGGKVNEPTVLTSGDGIYDTYMNCTWTIEAPADKIVVVKFIKMNLEARSCNYDYVELYNGHLLDINERIIKTCGFLQSEIPVFRSTGTKMLLHFVTDGSVNYEGFKIGIFFSYAESVGCGGHLNLVETSSSILTSPLIGNNTVYENFLDCYWTLHAPNDKVIKIEFLNFHVSSCTNVTNQTAIGYNKCDCDYVEIQDGINPGSSQIGMFCGHTMPPPLTSTGNLMSIRLSTDGEMNSSGFRARLSVHPTACGQTTFTISNNKQVIRSPGYQTGFVPRGLHCAYELISPDMYRMIHIRINNLDLQPGDFDMNHCTADKFVIFGRNMPLNISLGSQLIHEYNGNDFFASPYYFEETLNLPKRFELCGNQSSHDYYLYGSIVMDLFTSPNSDLKHYKGFEVEVVYLGDCGRNYTEPQGRIQGGRYNEYNPDLQEGEEGDCFTLISAPANYTISAYFINVSPDYWNDDIYLQVFDGKTTSSPSLIKIATESNSDETVFSTGNNLLLRSHNVGNDHVTYDLNYIITNKGRGCGGKLTNEFGRVASPLYPNIYRQTNTCEWELETPANTKLRLDFSVFDLGVACDQNYVKLVKRNGDTISTYCDETPTDYTSNDNYVKIVFTTNLNNGGTGWVANFIGVI